MKTLTPELEELVREYIRENVHLEISVTDCEVYVDVMLEDDVIIAERVDKF